MADGVGQSKQVFERSKVLRSESISSLAPPKTENTETETYLQKVKVVESEMQALKLNRQIHDERH